MIEELQGSMGAPGTQGTEVLRVPVAKVMTSITVILEAEWNIVESVMGTKDRRLRFDNNRLGFRVVVIWIEETQSKDSLLEMKEPKRLKATSPQNHRDSAIEDVQPRRQITFQTKVKGRSNCEKSQLFWSQVIEKKMSLIKLMALKKCSRQVKLIG